MISENCLSVQDVAFDPDRMMCCSIENGHTLVHGVGGRGYGLGATPIVSGCYQWRVRHVKLTVFCTMFKNEKKKSRTSTFQISNTFQI